MEVCGVGTEEKPDQAAESVKDSTPARKEQAEGTPPADESLQSTLASPTMPGTPRSAAAPPAKELDQTIPPGKEVPAATKEVPAATPPAARTPGAAGAAKSTSTPTATTTKGVPKPVAARATGAVVESTPDPPVNKM